MTFRVLKGTKFMCSTGPVQHVAELDSWTKCTADFTEKWEVYILPHDKSFIIRYSRNEVNRI